jgi:hypothetical protein
VARFPRPGALCHPTRKAVKTYTCGSSKYYPSVNGVLIIESQAALAWVFSRDRTFRDFECIGTRTQTSDGHACPALILRIRMRDGKIDNLSGRIVTMMQSAELGHRDDFAV